MNYITKKRQIPHVLEEMDYEPKQKGVFFPDNLMYNHTKQALQSRI